MNLLENRILAEGKIFPGNILKVDSFLNHQIDPILIKQMGKEIADHFMNKEVTKVVTIETSGIAIALTTAFELGVPMVFAKKAKGQNMSDSVYVSHVFSYTKKTESRHRPYSFHKSQPNWIIVLNVKMENCKGLPGGPEVKTPCFPRRGHKFNPGQGTTVSHAMWRS